MRNGNVPHRVRAGLVGVQPDPAGVRDTNEYAVSGSQPARARQLGV